MFTSKSSRYKPQTCQLSGFWPKCPDVLMSTSQKDVCCNAVVKELLSVLKCRDVRQKTPKIGNCHALVNVGGIYYRNSNLGGARLNVL